MKQTGISFYNAREKLRDEAYKEDHDKHPCMDWGNLLENILNERFSNTKICRLEC